MAPHVSKLYKFQVPISLEYENFYCLIGYDPKSWYYIKEENPEFGRIAGNILMEEYETAESLNRFRIRAERKLYNARDDLLKKPLSSLLLGVRCITAATPQRDIIIATYLDLKPLKTFSWPRRCPKEILFYTIIKERALTKGSALYESLQTTHRIISNNFDWLYELAPEISPNAEESPDQDRPSSISSGSDINSVTEQDLPNHDTDGEDADDEI